MLCDEPEGFTFQAPDPGIRRAAESRSAFGHDVHHELEIGRRARDDAKDLAGRCLLLQRLGHPGMGFGERLVLLLQLREQPDVLDGDHRLVSEGLGQLDLPVGEGPDLSSPHIDGTD